MPFPLCSLDQLYVHYLSEFDLACIQGNATLLNCMHLVLVCKACAEWDCDVAVYLAKKLIGRNSC